MTLLVIWGTKEDTTTKRHLTLRELKEFMRRYQADDEDSRYGNNLSDSGSESEGCKP